MRVDAVNLGQGFPEGLEPKEVVEAAMRALRDGPHQYPPMLGLPALRQAIAANAHRFFGLEVDWEREVLVTSGATEALADAFFGLLNPGDEVILIEPAYDSYPVIVRRAGAIPVPVRLRPPKWELPRDELEAAITPRTRAIVINTPMNPIGKIFGDDDLRFVADLMLEHDLIAIADEVYEHLVFDGRRHKTLFALPEVRDRVVRIGSAGKTFSVTGWKVGYVTADAKLIAPIARAHQFVTFTTPPALQSAVAFGLSLPDSYFLGLQSALQERRDFLVEGLRQIGFDVGDVERDLFRGRRGVAFRRGGRRRRILPTSHAPGRRDGCADLRLLRRTRRQEPYPLLLRQEAGDAGGGAPTPYAMERSRELASGVVTYAIEVAPGFHRKGDVSAPSVAIVGAGFSGALLAVHLTRQAVGRLDIALIDRAGSRGRGLAYGAVNPHHLLNVRVENMSALPEHPNHFRDWLERRTGKTPDPLAFVSRGLYGAYIEEILATAVESTSGRVSINPVAADCVDIRRDRSWTLGLADGGAIAADAVALCLGHFPPRFPGSADAALGHDPRAIRNPWTHGSLAAVAPGDRVVIIGSGLTMADVAVELQDRGHRGPIVVVSRHGLLPNVHAPTTSWPNFIDPERPPQTSLALLELVRREVAQAKAMGADWRAVVDSLRPHLIPLWRALPLEEQRRALRHLRAYWEVHRHRIAPKIDARLSALRAEGRLKVIAGALVAGRSTPDAIEIDVRLRGAGRIEALRADWVVNCTGPTTASARTADPLVRALLSQGFAKPDRVGLGLDVTGDCAVVDASDHPHDTLFATGPLTRGAFWEMLAVPELRRQAPETARRVLEALGVGAQALVTSREPSRPARPDLRAPFAIRN